MTEPNDPHSDPPGSAGQTDAAQRRRARQARIALLRNPNRKPLPPPRRPPLLGRNLKLRSTRRPASLALPVEGAGDLPPAAAAPDEALVRDAEGRILRIDVDRLHAITQQMLPAARPARSAYAEHILGTAPKPPDPAPPAPPEPQPAPKSLRELLTEPIEVPPDPAPPVPGWRRLIDRLTGRP